MKYQRESEGGTERRRVREGGRDGGRETVVFLRLVLIWAWRVQADSCKSAKHSILGDPRSRTPPPSCLRDLEAFHWSGGRSDPHVSKLTFGLESEYFCFQDLNRPSSHSKAEFLAWAAQTGQIRAIFGGYSAETARCIPLNFYGLDSYGPGESKPTAANQPNTGSWGTPGHVPPPTPCLPAGFGSLPVVGQAF